jgi:peptidoglycan hydrolase-like protein with peptidoglycan-binding domain
MAQEWTSPPDETEPLDVEEPVGSDHDLDAAGYDATDDPGSRPPDESLPPSRGPDRGPTSYPVAPAAIPGWVKQFGNGKIPVDRMLKVAPLGAGYLVPEAAAAWRNLQNAAKAGGFPLTMTGAYRSYDQQVELFNQRYSTSDTGGGQKVWNGTRYWLRPNMAMAATPGTSNHGWGCAVDVALGGYGAEAKTVDASFLHWALGNAAANGWSWEVQSEPWHLRLTATSAAPQAAVATAAAPVLQKAPEPTLRLQSVGGQVAALQFFCLKFGWGDCGSADGNFGPRTETAVKAMQTALGAASDGVYGPQSATALGDFLARSPSTG